MTLVPQWDIPARSCLRCGFDYLPRGTHQKYCDDCIPVVQRIQARNRMRRMRRKRAAIAARNAPVFRRNAEIAATRGKLSLWELDKWRKRQQERRNNGLD